MLYNLFNQKSQNSENLQQGLDFNHYIKLNNSTFNNMINGGSTNNITSVIESLEGIDSINSNTNVESDNLNNISDLEKQYQKVLSEYTNNYQLLMKTIIQSNKQKDNYGEYYGQIVSDKTGNYTYINDFGYTQKYSNNTWDSKDKSCPISISGSFDTTKLSSGADMGISQPCNLIGVNIRNEETDQKAWVDIKGYKHIYPDDIWSNKQQLCNIVPIDVSSNEYISIPISTEMQSGTVCDKLGVDPILWNKLIKLNTSLISIAKELSTEIGNINMPSDSSYNSSEMQSDTTITANTFNDHLKILELEKQKLEQLNTQLPTLSSSYNDSKLEVTSNYYSYLAWFIGAAVVGIITVKHL